MDEAAFTPAGDFGKLQQLMAQHGALHATGAPVPLEYWRAWQGVEPGTPGTTGRLDPATGLVHYTLQDDAGFVGTFLEFAEVPAIFAAAIVGANAITGALGSGAAAAPAQGAFLGDELLVEGVINPATGAYTPSPAGWGFGGANLAPIQGPFLGDELLIEGVIDPATGVYTPNPPGWGFTGASSLTQAGQLATRAGSILDQIAGGSGAALGKGAAGLTAAGLSTLLGGGSGVPEAAPVAVQSGGAGLVLLIGAAAAVLLILKAKK